jgi:hypothetical protein
MGRLAATVRITAQRRAGVGMRKTAVAIKHVHFEDPGSFDAVLTAAGY